MPLGLCSKYKHYVVLALIVAMLVLLIDGLYREIWWESRLYTVRGFKDISGVGKVFDGWMADSPVFYKYKARLNRGYLHKIAFRTTVEKIDAFLVNTGNGRLLGPAGKHLDPSLVRTVAGLAEVPDLRFEYDSKTVEFVWDSSDGKVHVIGAIDTDTGWCIIEAYLDGKLYSD